MKAPAHRVIEKGFRRSGGEREILFVGQASPRLWFVVAGPRQASVWRKVDTEFCKIETVEYAKPAINGYDVFCGYGEEEMPAAVLSEWLAIARDRNAFDRIILVSSEKMLSAFRKRLPTDLLACIAAEIPKDLTRLGQKDLEDALHKIIVL